jgi:hypothetical protein
VTAPETVTIWQLFALCRDAEESKDYMQLATCQYALHGSQGIDEDVIGNLSEAENERLDHMTRRQAMAACAEWITEPRTGWRDDPPTIDEVRRRSRWWYRNRHGDLRVLELAIGRDLDDPRIEFGRDCQYDGDRLDAAEWPGSWAPCLTPDEVATMAPEADSPALGRRRGLGIGNASSRTRVDVER